MPSSSHILDRLDVSFDDDHAVADAGLVLPATLLEHLDAEATADAVVSRGYRPGQVAPSTYYAAGRRRHGRSVTR